MVQLAAHSGSDEFRKTRAAKAKSNDTCHGRTNTKLKCTATRIRPSNVQTEQVVTLFDFKALCSSVELRAQAR